MKEIQSTNDVQLDRHQLKYQSLYSSKRNHYYSLLISDSPRFLSLSNNRDPDDTHTEPSSSVATQLQLLEDFWQFFLEVISSHVFSLDGVFDSVGVGVAGNRIGVSEVKGLDSGRRVIVDGDVDSIGNGVTLDGVGKGVMYVDGGIGK